MSASSDLAASPNIKVITELKLTIEAMLRAAADLITDERSDHHILEYQTPWPLHLLFVLMRCNSGDLQVTVDTYSQTAVAIQSRRHIHDVIMNCNGPSVLLKSQHVNKGYR